MEGLGELEPLNHSVFPQFTQTLCLETP